MTNIVNIVADKSELAMKRKKNIKLLMEEPYFQSAIDEVRQDLVTAWANTTLADSETREKLYFQIQAVDMVVEVLQTYANDVTFRKIQKEDEDAS